MGYTIHISNVAQMDIAELYNYIANDLCVPLTAARYRKGITDTIDSLAFSCTFHRINPSESLQNLYGPDARTVPYKKMSIVYNIVGSMVLIRRVIAGSLIR